MLVYLPTGSTAYVREISTAPTLLLEYGTLLPLPGSGHPDWQWCNVKIALVATRVAGQTAVGHRPTAAGGLREQEKEKLKLTWRYLESRVPNMRVMVSSLNGVIPMRIKWRRKRGDTTLRPPPGGAIAHKKCVS